jgi:hypothetical protein
MSNDKMISREANMAEKEMLVEKYKTALKKQQFINELKSGLGDEIKKNPNKAKIIEKKWYQRFGIFFKNIFTKF